MLLNRFVLLAMPAAVSLGYFAAGPTSRSGPTALSAWTVAPANAAVNRPDPHGLRLPVEIRVVPKQVRSSAAGEALDVDLDLVNTTDGPLKTVVSFEVMDDLGNPVVSKVVGAAADIPAKFTANSAAAGVPQAAADGYYFVKATVAWKGTDTDGTTSDYFYYRVRRGRIESVSADDWVQLSRANEGVAR